MDVSPIEAKRMRRIALIRKAIIKAQSGGRTIDPKKFAREIMRKMGVSDRTAKEYIAASTDKSDPVLED